MLQMTSADQTIFSDVFFLVAGEGLMAIHGLQGLWSVFLMSLFKKILRTSFEAMVRIQNNLTELVTRWSFIAPLWKRGGYIGFGLSVIRSVCLSVHPSSFFRENSFIEFIQSLFVHWYWHDLAWGCYTSFFPKLYQSYGSWFTPKFPFRSIFWEQIDRFSQNFIYAFILTRSSLGCYRLFLADLHQSYGPWLTPKFCFRSISREQTDWFSPNFIYAFILARSSLGLLHKIFLTFIPELWPLINTKISFPLNISRTKRLIFT